MTNSNSPAYLCIKSAVASKLGQRGHDGIGYLILADVDRQHLFVTLTSNAGGGYFSREIVPFAVIDRCIPADRALSFPAKIFAGCFVGQSSNNAGFMAAVLRREGLLGPVPDKVHQHLLTGDWQTWKSAMLAMAGTPYVEPVKAGVAKAASTILSGAEAVSPDSVDDEAVNLDSVDVEAMESEAINAEAINAVEPDTPHDPHDEMPKAGRKPRNRKAHNDEVAPHAAAE